MTLGASGPTTLTANVGYAQWRLRLRADSQVVHQPPELLRDGLVPDHLDPPGARSSVSPAPRPTGPRQLRPHLWLDSAGNLIWEVNGGTVSEMVSPSTYNNGRGTSSSPKLAQRGSSSG